MKFSVNSPIIFVMAGIVIVCLGHDHRHYGGHWAHAADWQKFSTVKEG